MIMPYDVGICLGLRPICVELKAHIALVFPVLPLIWGNILHPSLKLEMEDDSKQHKAIRPKCLAWLHDQCFFIGFHANDPT